MKTIKCDQTFFHSLSGQTALVVLRSLLLASVVLFLGVVVAVVLASVFESDVDCGDFDLLLGSAAGSLSVSGAVALEIAACRARK